MQIPIFNPYCSAPLHSTAPSISRQRKKKKTSDYDLLICVENGNLRSPLFIKIVRSHSQGSIRRYQQPLFFQVFGNHLNVSIEALLPLFNRRAFICSMWIFKGGVDYLGKLYTSMVYAEMARYPVTCSPAKPAGQPSANSGVYQLNPQLRKFHWQGTSIILSQCQYPLRKTFFPLFVNIVLSDIVNIFNFKLQTFVRLIEFNLYHFPKIRTWGMYHKSSQFL